MKNTLLTRTPMLLSLTKLCTEKNLFAGRGFYGIFILPLLLFCTSLSAQIVLTSGQTADQYVEKIIGQGIEYSNAQIVGNSNQIATYTGGAGGGMQPTMNSGIVLSTGYVNTPTWLQGPSSIFRSTNTGGPTNSLELNALAGISSTYDVIYLEFDFIPLTDKLKINFQFGSEEYNEWVNTVFNDVFGFFISGPGIATPFPGENIAWAPNGARVAVNAINRGTACPANTTVNCNSTNPIGMGNCYSNPFYYIDNCSGVYDNAMDGFTVMLVAQADVIPCEQYHIRLAIADGTDQIYDSWVFLQESGFYADGTIVEGEVTHVDPEMEYVYEGCSGSQILFCIPEPLDEDYVVDIISVGGTATPFVDYLPLLPAYTIPAGETCVAIDIIALLDDLEEGIETIIIEYQQDVCNTAELTIEIHDSVKMTVEFDIDDIEECYDPANSFTLQPVVTDNVGTPIYVWNDGTSDISDEESITVNPEETTTYTVTVLDACGTEESASITIIVPEDDIEPIFSFNTIYCLDEVPDTLPLISDDGIEGVWSPGVIDTSAYGSIDYTFTPDSGQCALETVVTVTVQEEVVPTFNPLANPTICQGGFIPASSFPTTSTNEIPITGSWSPAPNNQATTTYTFTPNPGQCATEFQRTITVTPTQNPIFNNLPTTLCQGNNYSLPTISNNDVPITGSWFPIVSNQQPGTTVTYTFTPNPGQCSSLVTHQITVNPTTTPIFTQVQPICAGDPLAPLPTTSNNGVSGVWSPTLNNTQTTTYTFTPFASTTICGVPVQMTIVVNPVVTPTFDNLPATICEADDYELPAPNNDVAGSWSPLISDHQPGTTVTYTFTPSGVCPVEVEHDIYMEPIAVPEFDPVGPTCSGELIPPLPTTSNNGVAGSWSPALNYSQTTTYTFTPNAGVCATTQTMTIVVTQPATPVFTQVAPICEGEPLADLPTTSEDTNAITGTWSPAIDNTQTTTYTFTPDAGQCTMGATMTITVNPWVTPIFSISGICAGADSPLPNISDNGVTGTWSPEFDNMQTGTYTFTPDAGQCGVEETVTVTVVGSVTTPVLQPLEYCDPNSDGFGIFDLTQVIPIIESVNSVDVNVTFHETEDDALFNANNIAMYNPVNAYPNGEPYNQTIYVRVSNDSGCFAVIPLQLIVHDLPQITKNVPALLEECDDDYDGIAQFDLTDALADIMNTLDISLHTITYHLSENEARNNANAIPNFTNYSSASGSVWVRVEDNDTGCFDVVELILIVNPLPVVSMPEVDRYVLCDDDDDGYMIFDLETQIAGIINGQAGLTVTFHDTYADAESGSSPYNYIHQNNEPFVETVFVRVETEKGCFVITLMDLVVEPLPVLVPPTEPVAACDGDGDGFGEVDFTDTIEQMLNGANPDDYLITIHETIDDAELGAYPIEDLEAYRNTNPFIQIVYLRIQTIFGEECFDIYPITINVAPAPQLPVEQNGTLPNIVICDENTDGYAYFDFTGQTQYILDAQDDITDLEVTYHLNEQNAVDGVLAITTVTNYRNIVPFQQTVWVRIENTLTGCFDTAPFDLIVNLPLELPVPPAITLCDEDMDGNVEYNLTIRIPDILANAANPNNFTVDFFTSYAAAVAGDETEQIPDYSSYWSSLHVQTLGVRVTNNTTGCQSYTILDIRRAPMPNVPTAALEPIEGCQESHGSLTGIFDLTQRENFIRQGDNNLIITYHLTFEQAETGSNAIEEPENYVSVNTTIYIRIANPPNGGTVCARILEVEIIVNPIPVVADNAFEVCQTGSTGYAEFYFPDFNPDLLGPTQDLEDFSIAYYHSQADAENQNGAINQTVPYTNTEHGSEDLWVRITNNQTGCFVIEQITLYAEEAAQATQPADNRIFECDDWDGANDGFVTGIDLTVFESQILTGTHPYQIFYHTDEYEANQGLNAVPNPANFTNTVAGGQTIWVRVENSNTTAPCYELATLELIIEQPANPVISSDNNVLCVDWGATVANNPVVLDSGVSNTGYTFEWYHNGILLAGETQSTLTLNNLGEEGFYTVIAISDNGCISEMSDQFEVILSGAPEIINITTTNAFQDQQSVIVTVQGNGTYAYQLNDGPLQDNGHFTNVPAGVHTVTVYDISSGDINGLNSCGNDSRDDIQLIDYPKFFTPNGDGYNDNWNIIGLTEFHNAEIYIFDRYGKLIKQLNPTGDGWDGTYNGQQVPSTDYWFKVFYDEEDANQNTQRREFKAHFSLKR